MSYEVSWCVVGNDPDAQPFLFVTFEEAAQFLQDELFWVARDTDNNLVSKDAVEAGFVLKNHGDNTPTDYVFQVGNVSYWLMKSSEIAWEKI